jgi:hypothetical protein
MSSTSISSRRSQASEPAAAPLRWQTWPLVEHPRWSWTVPVGILAAGGGVTYLSGNWLAGLVATAALAISLWQFLLPVSYEISPLGLRRQALGRMRLVPWHAVRSYHPQATGVVLYPVPDPTAVDVLRSLFVPYPADEDEMLCAVREYLGHAMELPAR